MWISHAGCLLTVLCLISSGPPVIADDAGGKVTTVAVPGGGKPVVAGAD
jgi:hypothetical protein